MTNQGGACSTRYFQTSPASVEVYTPPIISRSIYLRMGLKKYLAGRQGFEPRSGGPEPPVLPLDDLPALREIVENRLYRFKAKPHQSATGGCTDKKHQKPIPMPIPTGQLESESVSLSELAFRIDTVPA